MTAFTGVLSSVIGALVGAIVSKIKTIKQQTEIERAEAEELRDLVIQNTLLTCRMAIYDDHFSIDEKIEAYKIYKTHGGNHKTKIYMDGVVGLDIDEYIANHPGK